MHIALILLKLAGIGFASGLLTSAAEHYFKYSLFETVFRKAPRK